MNYPNGYHPTEAKPESKPPKCGSAESDGGIPICRDFLEEENNRLKKKLRKVRKEKKRWKRKYRELYYQLILLKNYVYTQDNVLLSDEQLSKLKIEAGLGISPINTK